MPSVIVPNNSDPYTTVVDNVTDLRALTSAAIGTKAIYVRGYTTKNDGGGFWCNKKDGDLSTLDDSYSIFMLSDGTRVQRLSGPMRALSEFGPVNDTVSAYDTLLEDAAYACSEQNATLWLPPLVNGYPITTEITIPGGCSLICDAPIVDGSLTTHKGLLIGDDQDTVNYSIFDLWLVRTTRMNWSEVTSGIGIHFINLLNSWVKIRRVYGYNVNMRFTGAGTPGCAYNKIFLQISHQARHHIELEARLRSGDAVNGWVNENIFYGGRITNDGDFTSGSIPGGVTPAAVVFKSGNVSSYNNNKFLGLSIEQIPSGTTRANLWKLSGYSINNSMLDVREESNGTGAVVMEVDDCGSLSGANILTMQYSDDTATDGTARITDASTGTGSSGMTNTVVPPNAIQSLARPLDTWSASRMIESVTAYHTDGRISIPGLFWRTTTGGRTQASTGTGITVGSDYISIPSGYSEGPCVLLDTSRMKKFAVMVNPVTSYNIGRMAFICFDSTGTQITDGLVSTCRYPNGYYSGAHFGGSWITGSTALQDTIIDVGSNVHWVEVCLWQYAASGELRLRPFSIVNLSAGPLICRSYYDDDDGVTRFAIAKPADTTAKGNYQTGTFVKNASVSDATSVLGWRNLGGNGGSWHTIYTDAVAAGGVSYYNATGTAVAITTLSDGTNNFIKAAPTTALLTESAFFDNGGSNNGRLRYTGSRTQTFEVVATATISGASGDSIIAAIGKNGTVDQATRISTKMGASGEDQVITVRGIQSLAFNEYVELFLGNLTDADDPTVKSLIITATSV